MPTIFDELLATFRAFWNGVDNALVHDAVDRIDWEMPERPLTPNALSALRHLDRLAAMPAARPLVELLAGNRGGFRWGQTYTAKDFGQGFIDNYGWLEVFGTRGHFVHDEIAAGVLLLGPHGVYPDHHHVAEEIYIPLTGGTEWRMGNEPFRPRAAGEVVVTDQLQSSNPRVWAAGDVTGHPEFVYVAARHGTLVAENAFTDASTSVDYTRMPRVTFTSPAVGAVGMTEKEVIAAGIRCDCRVLPLEYVPRALVNRDTRGFIKMVANADTGEILGLTAVAKDAGELAAAGVHILGKTITEVADAWAPYLTTAEGIRIVAKAFTTDVSMLSCCA